MRRLVFLASVPLLALAPLRLDVAAAEPVQITPVALSGEVVVNELMEPTRAARPPFVPTLPQLLKLPPKVLAAVRAADHAYQTRVSDESAKQKPLPARRGAEKNARQKALKLLEKAERGPREELAYGVLLYQGAQLDNGDFEPALASMRAAAATALDLDAELYCRIQLLLADALVAARREPEALVVILEAEDLAEATGCPVEARHREAIMATTDGKLDDARGLYRRNLAVLATPSTCTPQLAEDAASLAWLAFRQGDCREVFTSGVHFERALANGAPAKCRDAWSAHRPEWLTLAATCIGERGALADFERAARELTSVITDVKRSLVGWQSTHPTPTTAKDALISTFVTCYAQAVRADATLRVSARITGSRHFPVPSVKVRTEPVDGMWAASEPFTKCVSSRLARSKWRGAVSGELVLRPPGWVPPASAPAAKPVAPQESPVKPAAPQTGPVKPVTQQIPAASAAPSASGLPPVASSANQPYPSPLSSAPENTKPRVFAGLR